MPPLAKPVLSVVEGGAAQSAGGFGSVETRKEHLSATIKD
jgi:hypothetical protein